jgi:hypothetical protein
MLPSGQRSATEYFAHTVQKEHHTHYSRSGSWKWNGSSPTGVVYRSSAFTCSHSARHFYWAARHTLWWAFQALAWHSLEQYCATSHREHFFR